MSQITINLPDERMEKLKQLAARFQIGVADLVEIGVEDLLSQPDEKFREAMEYVFKKNAELYRRLS